MSAWIGVGLAAWLALWLYVLAIRYARLQVSYARFAADHDANELRQQVRDLQAQVLALEERMDAEAIARLPDEQTAP